MDQNMTWRMLLTSVMLILVSAVRCASQTLPPEVQADSRFSQFVPLELHPGLNDVTFYGTQWHDHGYRPGTSLVLANLVPFQQPGQIYEFVSEANETSYLATAQYLKPFTNIPLADGPGFNFLTDGYGIGNWRNTGNTVSGLDQYVAFFQGLLNGQKQTFFVTAQTQFTHLSGDAEDNSRAQHVNINIFAFSGGTASNSSPNFPEAPGFEPIGGFETKYNYCDAEYAMLLVLPLVPPPLQQLQVRQMLARQSMKQQTCP